MTDIGSFLAVGLAGFIAGAAYAGKEHLSWQRAAVLAGAFVVDAKGYYVTSMFNDDDPEPAPTKPGELVAFDGGRAGDAA